MNQVARAVAWLVPLVISPSLVAGQVAPAQPSHSFLVSGYTTINWGKTQGVSHGFAASLSPVLLFAVTERVFAEAELELELEDGATNTVLEYGTVHYFATDHLTLSAGKFLLPFGVFGQRLHPSWINRFASPPPVYGHHGGIPGHAPLLPILSDVGAMVKLVAPLGGGQRSLKLSAFLTNGPQVEADEHGEEGQEDNAVSHRPEFSFGSFGADNNDAKMFGGRAGLEVGPSFELDLSVLRSRWGEGEATATAGQALNLTGVNVAAEYRVDRPLELRTEWLWLRTDIEHADEIPAEIETLAQFGGYAQAAYRTGNWEPVVRFGFVDGDQDDDDQRLTQYGLGLNYWVTPSVALKAALEVNRDRFLAGEDLANNRFLLQWAVGF